MWGRELKQDLTYAIRTLSKSGWFALTAVVTLALGIGANTAIFSVINGVLLRPQPYRDADRLAFLWSTSQSSPREPLTPGRLVDFRDQLTTASGIAGISQFSFNLTEDGEPERIAGSSVSSSFFDVLGTPPLLGDVFHSGTADDQAVVLSHGLWTRRFAGDRSIIGRRLVLNGSARTVVAVMPAAFNWPVITGSPSRLPGPELWIPGTVGDVPRTPVDQPNLAANRTAGYLRAVVRLKDGVTLDQARQEAQAHRRQAGPAVPGRGRRPGSDAGAAHHPVRRAPAPADADSVRRRRLRAGHRLRQHRQPAARPRRRTAAGVRGARRPRRQPRPGDTPAADRIDRAGVGRCSRRRRRRVVVPSLVDAHQPRRPAGHRDGGARRPRAALHRAPVARDRCGLRSCAGASRVGRQHQRRPRRDQRSRVGGAPHRPYPRRTRGPRDRRRPGAARGRRTAAAQLSLAVPRRHRHSHRQPADVRHGAHRRARAIAAIAAGILRPRAARDRRASRRRERRRGRHAADWRRRFRLRCDHRRQAAAAAGRATARRAPGRHPWVLQDDGYPRRGRPRRCRLGYAGGAGRSSS